MEAVLSSLIGSALYDAAKWYVTLLHGNDSKNIQELIDKIAKSVVDDLWDYSFPDEPTIASHLEQVVHQQSTASILRQYLVALSLGAWDEYRERLERELSTSLRIGFPGTIEDFEVVDAELQKLVLHIAQATLDSAPWGLRERMCDRGLQDLTLAHLRAIDRNLATHRRRDDGTIDEYIAFEKTYAAQVNARHQWITPPQLESAQRVKIDALYVKPMLTFLREGSNAAEIAVDDLVTAGGRYVVLGDPGAGKSTLTQRLCHDIAGARGAPNSQKNLIPILVVLREYGVEKDKSNCSILDFIKTQAKSRYQTTPPEGSFEFILSNSRAMVLFDGLDEMLDSTYRQEVTGDVESFCQMYPGLPVLTTSRRRGYEQAPLDPRQFETVLLAPLGSNLVREYVQKWFNADSALSPDQREQLIDGFLAESSVVEELTSNPLMLALMCSIYRGQGYIPRSRPDVYEKCAVMLFDRWDRSRGLRVELQIEAHVEPALSHVAHWMYSTPTTGDGVLESTLIEVVVDYLREWRFEDRQVAILAAREFVAFCRGRAWVFTDIGTNAVGEVLYHFTHRTFLEYFAALHLSRSSPTSEELAAKIVPYIERGEWDVVAQLAVQIHNRTVAGSIDVILRRLAEVDLTVPVSDLSGVAHRLNFAARCLEFLVPKPLTVREVVRTSLEVCKEFSSQLDGSISDRAGSSLSSVLPAFVVCNLQNHPPIMQELLRFFEEALVEPVDPVESCDWVMTAVVLLPWMPNFGRSGAASKVCIDPWMDFARGVVRERADLFNDFARRLPFAEFLLSTLCIDGVPVVDEDYSLARYFGHYVSPYWQAGFLPLVIFAAQDVLHPDDRRLSAGWRDAVLSLVGQKLKDGERPRSISPSQAGTWVIEDVPIVTSQALSELPQEVLDGLVLVAACFAEPLAGDQRSRRRSSITEDIERDRSYALLRLLEKAVSAAQNRDPSIVGREWYASLSSTSRELLAAWLSGGVDLVIDETLR